MADTLLPDPVHLTAEAHHRMTSGLATLVAGIWTEAGYETTISHRDGETYVLAEHAAAGTYDLLWVLDPGTELTVEGVERYRSRIATLDVEDAYAVTAAALEDRIVERAASHGIEAVGNLRSLAGESGVGQDAVDAALATTVGADGDDEAGEADSGRTAVDGDPHDPDTQAEIRRRMAVMMGEADPDDDPDADAAGGDDRSADDAGVAPTAEAGGGGGADDEHSAEPDASDDGGGAAVSDADESDAETHSDDGDDDPLGSGEGNDLDALGGSDLPGGDLPEDPAGESDDGGGGPLSSRRGLITGGVAAVLSAGVLDFTMFNLFLGGGGGLPAYNETRVKSEATGGVPPDVLVQTLDSWTEEPVTYDPAVVDTVEKSGGLWSVTFSARGGRIVGRWDGEEPTIDGQYAVWGVVTGTTTVDGTELPQIDVVDMTTGGGGGGGSGTTTTSGGGATTAAGTTADGNATTAAGDGGTATGG